MSLKSVVLCSDDKIVRVLRRVLGDLDIAIEHCTHSDSALQKLTRSRFEAIIVDCATPGASDVLRSARNAACNKQSVAVAVVEPVMGLKDVFGLGAHFVLYKPVSSERAKSSFRAARALMKSERRRNARVAVEIPVTMQASGDLGGNLRVVTIDVSEGGMAVKVPHKRRFSGRWQIAFTLPGNTETLQIPAEFAWEGSSKQAGLRFVDTSPEATRQLREWLQRNSPDVEQDDPPVRCQLTDLTLGGCYLGLTSPFPPQTRVTLSMRAASLEVRVQGVVRVMHPDQGMGVEFTQATAEHRTAVEKFLGALTENRNLLPELLVQPDGLESGSTSAKAASTETDDPLLQLFRGEALSPEEFHAALRKQRGSHPEPCAASAAHA